MFAGDLSVRVMRQSAAWPTALRSVLQALLTVRMRVGSSMTLVQCPLSYVGKHDQRLPALDRVICSVTAHTVAQHFRNLFLSPGKLIH